MKTMHPKQKAYAVALAAEQTVRAHFEAAKKAAGIDFDSEMTDEQYDSMERQEEQIRVDLRLDHYVKARQSAEDAMVRWSVEVACKTAPQHAEILRDTYQRAKQSVRHWDKMVDIAFRLHP